MTSQRGMAASPVCPCVRGVRRSGERERHAVVAAVAAGRGRNAKQRRGDSDRLSDGVTRIDSATVIHVAQAVPSSVVGTPLSVTRMRGGRDDLADVVAVIFEQVPVGGRLGGGSC